MALNGELERFVEDDEQIRKELNRKERVETIKQRGNHKVRQSIDQVEKVCSRSRSPRKPLQRGE